MKNKGLVIFLTLIISVLCLYHLLFTYADHNIQETATHNATNKQGIINFSKKQSYLDSVWNLPAYNLFGFTYSYKEVKEHALTFGLDLQGGMHFVLEVSSADVIKNLSANHHDSAFLKAIRTARSLHKNNQQNFSKLFFDSYRKVNPTKNFALLFANDSINGKISLKHDDSTVIKVIQEEIENTIDRSVIVLRNRLNQSGISEPSIQRLPDSEKILIEIAGTNNSQRIRKLLQDVAKLEFWDVIDPASIDSSLLMINDVLIKEHTASINKSSSGIVNDSGNSTTTTPDSLQPIKSSALLSLRTEPELFRYQIKDTARINAIFSRADIKNLLPKTVGIYWANKSQRDKNGKDIIDLFFLALGDGGQSKLTGDVITDARKDLDESGNQVVSMAMNPAGTKIWAKWTAEVSAKSPQGKIAIMLDKTVYSAPSVSGEIPNGNSQISGGLSAEEATDLVSVLNSGSLPVPTQILDEEIIGSTISTVAQRNGIISIVCCLALIIIFMSARYGIAGFASGIVVVFNLFFITGILAQFDVVLTLPAIAGFVLTIFIATVANIIILNPGKTTTKEKELRVCQ
jgi:SecD/SecF fusion protein